jgi:siroheme synthase (precorrin-2 oxidase/ferrochelatase)
LNEYESGLLQGRDMTVPRFLILNAAALALSISTSYAGPCPIEGVRAGIDALLTPRVAAWPSAPESVAAMMHRQPTQGSVAAAEERLARLSVQSIAVATHHRHMRGRLCR